MNQISGSSRCGLITKPLNYRRENCDMSFYYFNVWSKIYLGNQTRAAHDKFP